MTGVRRRFGKASYSFYQLFPADSSCLFDHLSLDDLRNRRTARHGGDASFRAETNVGDAVAFELDRKFQNVPAGGVFQLRGSVGRLDVSGVARILKMVEDFEGIHSAIVNPRSADSLPYNVRMPGSYGPRRIACLQPSATVILAHVGELDRVVACTKYCADVVPEVRQGNRLIIADSWTSKAHEILAAEPDLVIAAVPYQEVAVAEILKAGVRFLGLAPRTLADIYADIAMIAGIVGAGDRAARVISYMQDAIEEIRGRTAAMPRKRVYCEEWGKPLITSQPWVAELVHAAGGEFIGDPGKQILPDLVAERDPEVIIAAWCGAGRRVPLAKIVRDRGWSGTSAARNSQIYCISDELLNTPAPTVTEGLRALAAAIHPEAFVTVPGLRPIADEIAARVSPAQRVI